MWYANTHHKLIRYCQPKKILLVDNEINVKYNTYSIHEIE